MSTSLLGMYCGCGCVRVCVCMCVFVCMGVCVCVGVCMCACMCLYVSVCGCGCVCVCVCMCGCVGVGVFVCVYVWVCVGVCVCVHARIHARTHAWMDECMYWDGWMAGPYTFWGEHLLPFPLLHVYCRQSLPLCLCDTSLSVFLTYYLKNIVVKFYNQFHISRFIGWITNAVPYW